MRKNIAIASCIAIVIALVGVSTPASAATFKKIATKSYKAYDYNGYRATIKPSGYTIPSGYVDAGSTVTIKKGARTLAANRKSYSANAGTYTAFSTIRYRSKSSYTTTQTQYLDVDNYETCTVTSSSLTDSGVTQDDYDGSDVIYQEITNHGTCSGYSGNPDDDIFINSFTGTWVSTYYGCAILSYGGYSNTGCTVDDIKTPIGQVIDFDPYDNPNDQNGYDVCNQSANPDAAYDCSSDMYTSTAPYRTKITKYRYGPVKVKRFKRTVVVKKKNSAFITLSEWRGLRSGMTVSRVSSLFGNSGYIYAVNGNRTARAYRDINKDGSYYSTYYLVFRSGRLYAWDGTQWGNG